MSVHMLFVVAMGIAIVGIIYGIIIGARDNHDSNF